MQDGFLSRELTSFAVSGEKSSDIINILGLMLKKKGYIKDAYIDGVIAREKIFPTGLVLANAGIAIPHASPEGNVLKNGIAVARLAKPVIFHSMENPEDEVAADMVFMLALSDSNQHIDVLKKLFTAFQDEVLVAKLKQMSNEEEFVESLKEKLA